jgi:hypothetical protein
MDEGDALFLHYVQELDDRGYEKKEDAEPDPLFVIWESPDVEVQLFFRSERNPPRARQKGTGRPLVFNDLLM